MSNTENDDNPKLGGNELLATAMQQVLKEKKWSLRQAEIATGVRYGTINRMLRGLEVEAESIARFAFRISSPETRFQTVVHWLRIARKDDLASVLSAVEATAHRVSDDDKTRIISPSGRTVLVLPSGREIQPTEENIALMETMFATLDSLKQANKNTH